MTDKAENKGEVAQEDKGAPKPRQDLPPAAVRALKEAEERREKRAYDPSLPRELNGRKGPEPIRYGDWEKDGIVSDF